MRVSELKAAIEHLQNLLSEAYKEREAVSNCLSADATLYDYLCGRISGLRDALQVLGVNV